MAASMGDGMPDVRAFEPLGLAGVEERTYRVLLHRPDVSAAELASCLHLPDTRIRTLLSGLAAKGLAAVVRERPRRYRAIPPDIALDRLMRRQAEALARAGAAAAALVDEFRPAAFRVIPGDDVIEILDTGERVRQAIVEVQRSAVTECICLDKPPYVTGPPHTVDPAEIEGLARGVAYRTLIDIDAAAMPGVAERARTCVEAGAQIRVASGLSMKLLIADDRVGLVPMSLASLGGPVLLVRASSLLEALREYFDVLWRRAMPVTFSAAPTRPRTVDEQLQAEIERQILWQLAAGANDKAIVASLGLSSRTLDRRIDALMRKLDAKTRFQAGWLAACESGATRGTS